MKKYPIVWQPEDMNKTFAKAHNSGDVEQMLVLYEPTAVHIASSGKIAKGLHEIKQDLLGLLQVYGYMISNNLSTIINDELALLQAHFILKERNGENVIVEGITSEVIRKQPDGSWKYMIDRPFSQVIADGIAKK
jgi:ketosteroid isomerase-like protein